MAKRLNKKVAIIGSLFLTMILFVGIVMGLKLRKGDPEVFITNAENVFSQAEALIKEYEAKGDYSEEAIKAVEDAYKEVDRNYLDAFGCAKDDAQRIELLFTMVGLYQIDNKFHSPEWPKIIGRWRQITTTDPKNIQSRLNLLNFIYDQQLSIIELMPDGNPTLWVDIKKQADELIGVMKEKDVPATALTAHVLKARAWATLGMAPVENRPEKYIEEAIEQFQKLLEVDPGDAEIYELLGQAYIALGERRGRSVSDAMEKARAKQDEILLLGVEKGKDKALANVNLLKVRLLRTNGQRELIDALKEEYTAFSAQYPSSPDVHVAFSRFLAIFEPSVFDGAIEEISKAIDLDSTNAIYAITKAEFLFNKSTVEADTGSLEEGIKIAMKALEFPEVSTESGPKQFAARVFRSSLYAYLAKSHVERAVIAQAEDDDAQSERSVSEAEKAIHKLKQYAKADEFVNKKWDGLLAMVKGDKITAISNLYYAQEMLKVEEKIDALVSYYLSKVLEGRTEIGSRIEFLTDALINKFSSTSFASIASNRPDALLEYGELLLQMNSFDNAKNDVARFYEEKFGSNDRSKAIIVRCDIASRNFVDAEDMISKMDPESGRTLGLRLQLVSTRTSYMTLQLTSLDPVSDKYEDNSKSLKEDIDQLKAQRFVLVMKLIEIEPVYISFPVGIYVQLLKDGKTKKAKELTDAYIVASENNYEALFYKELLAEADPLHVPIEKQDEIRQRIFSNTADEVQRHILLGNLYSSKGENEKSLAEYKAALEVDPDNKTAVGGVFDMSLKLDDIDGATAILSIVRKNDIDNCGGEFFAARIDIVNKEYDSAIKRIDECLKIRPVFPYAYILKSQIYANKGNHEEAIKNAMAAARINSFDGNIAKQVVLAIEARNVALGNNVSDSHREEMVKALRRAVILNPKELQIQNLYVRYISESDPKSAISIQQRLTSQYPTVENYLLLGRMAKNMAVRKINKAEKQICFDIAEPAFKKAYEMSPQDNGVVDSYCEFLRLTGKHGEAMKILEDNGDLLWVFHLRDGKFEEAKTILNELNQADPKNVKVLRGLMRACKGTSDKEGLKKYSEQLLVVDNGVDNQLLQIQMYLDSGLVSEATAKLAGFRTRHPDEQRGLLLEAWSTMANGKLDAALKLVDKYLAIDPENSIAWRLRGQIHSISGDYQKAIQDMDKSKSIKDTPTIQIELAKVYSRSGNMASAIGVLSKALEDDRAPMQMLEMLEEFYTRSGRKTDLRSLYRKTLQRYPENINWYFRAGRFSLSEGKFSDAEKYFLKALELGKGTKGSHVILDGYLSAIRGARKYPKAIRVAAKYIDDPEYAPIAYLNMANAEDKLDNREKSLECFLKAIEKSGDNSFYILKMLSNMSSVLGFDEVVNWCNKDLARDPSSFAANRMMSIIMTDRQQFNEAIVYIEKCMEGFAPDTDKYFELLSIKANIAVTAYMKTSKDSYLETAIKSNSIILDKNRNNSGVLNNLAYFLAKTGRDVDKAVEYASRAHKMSPNDANVMDTYAFTLCKSGDYKQAKELILSAIGIIEKDSIELPWDLVNHLGMANEGLSEMQEAKDNYKKALELAGGKISSKDKQELIAAVSRVSN